jgi:hypothetical protein
MHLSPSVDLPRRLATWLAPGGWLVLEEPDFGMWIGDASGPPREQRSGTAQRPPYLAL